MAPSVGAIVRGMAFVLIGLLKVLCDRWQLETTAQGRISAHTFNHIIILLFMEQMLQVCLIPFYHAMERNWCGFQIFYHGDMVHRPNPNLILGPPRPEPDDLEDLADATPINVNEEDMGQENPQACADAPPAEIEAQEEEEEDFDEQPRRRRPSRLLCLVPGCLWIFQALLVHFGLDLTYGSSFIMMKGTMTIFTALLGIAFLAQQLFCHIWIGILVSCAGFAVAGISDYLKKPKGGYEKYGVASGVLLILMSQICIACKLIHEEKYLRKHSMHPMKFLGWEGVFGFVLCAALLTASSLVEIPDYYSYVIPKTQHLEDIVDAAIQLAHSWQLIVAFLGSIVLSLVWNYLGLLMVRDHGALPRIMIETLVWMFYWVVCLGLRWENFYVGHIPGLCMIAVGLLLYGNILPLFPICNPRVADINLNRLYLNRERHRYEPLDEQEEEDAHDGGHNQVEAGGNEHGSQAGTSGAQKSKDPISSDEDYDEHGTHKESTRTKVKTHDTRRKSPKTYNESSSDEDEGAVGGRKNSKTSSVLVERISSSSEDNKVPGDINSPSPSESSNAGADDDDEILYIGPELGMSAPRQGDSDSSSCSSNRSGQRTPRDDEMLLQA
ncbi:solute carrier family 35 member F6 [Elysia marginata]|uniref:Solute carrier family 35 member F6 n=1 Tax=Elysia marginata TaxID=1093978 RepID=A0AAV4HTJ4_9GAST|nr:solute carrier family 35 member F6 [Elysia marginata]